MNPSYQKNIKLKKEDMNKTKTMLADKKVYDNKDDDK